ncbi:MAG TPA: hypothetical protein VM661_16725 [Candidatus Sulfotelmatobacter sp.]|jgi:hypothetical protein|nr:hypothetical protein [Candidatus Sulfotelmatobacter sp.]
MIPNDPCRFILGPGSGFRQGWEEQAACHMPKFAEFSHIRKNIGYFGCCSIDEIVTPLRSGPADLTISSKGGNGGG